MNRKSVENVKHIKDLLDDLNQNIQVLFQINADIYKPDVGIYSRYSIIENKVNLNKNLNTLKDHFNSLKTNSLLLISNKISKREFQEKTLKLFSKLDSSKLGDNSIITNFVDIVSDYYNMVLLHYDKLKQIGTNLNEGIFANLNLLNTQIIDELKKTYSNIDYQSNRYTNRFIISIILFTIFSVFFVFLVVFIVYIKSIRNLDNISTNVNNLNEGILDLDLMPSPFIEISAIIEKLKNLAESLKQKKNFIYHLTSKQYNEDISFSKYDELGQSLLNLRKKLIESEKEAEQYRETEMHQKWIATGIAQIGAVMRQYSDNIFELSKNILKSTLEYVGAVQGVIYVYNAEENYLEQTAAYAFGKNRLKQSIIRPYEGLLGTILVEKKPYFIEKVPDDYLFFETGFGYGTPRNIFAFPLLFENKIYGVIEIASLEEIPEYKRTFLLRLANEIANTILYVEINTRTKKLLEQSNKQAQELISNQKFFKKNQENLKSLLKMTEEQLNEKNELLKDREKIIKEKIDYIFQLEKEIVTKDEIIENISTEFDNIKKMMEAKISEQQRKIDELTRKLNQKED